MGDRRGQPEGRVADEYAEREAARVERELDREQQEQLAEFDVEHEHVHVGVHEVQQSEREERGDKCDEREQCVVAELEEWEGRAAEWTGGQTASEREE